MPVEREVKIAGFAGSRNSAPVPIEPDACHATQRIRQIANQILGHWDMEIRIIRAQLVFFELPYHPIDQSMPEANTVVQGACPFLF